MEREELGSRLLFLQSSYARKEGAGPHEGAILRTPQPPQQATRRRSPFTVSAGLRSIRVTRCPTRTRPKRTVHCVPRLKEPIDHHRRGPIGLMFSRGCGVGKRAGGVPDGRYYVLHLSFWKFYINTYNKRNKKTEMAKETTGSNGNKTNELQKENGENELRVCKDNKDNNRHLDNYTSTAIKLND
ncbi:unnamed protein product [Spodoptera exigua]|nr:unnamed protein product [Spodoptera exigua]